MPNDIHGFIDEVPWDYAGIPDRVWERLTALPNGCWVAENSRVARWLSMTVVERITRRNPHDALAITPTCANVRCCNPAHLCVTWANETSRD